MYPVSRKYTTHDKLIIVDSRYVVVGSHNWSIKALKQNNEASSIIDSPQLAREYLSRVRNFPLEEERLARQTQLEELRNPPPLPENTKINLPKALLEDKNLLPRMLSRREKRTFNAYFLLILRGYAAGRGTLPEEFPVSVADLADELKIPIFWAVKRHRWNKVSDILHELRDYYGLIDIDFRYGPEEWVHIKKLAGDTFPVEADFFEAATLNARSTRAKFVYLLKALLKEEGKTLDTYTKEELAEKYHIGLKQLRWGMRELE
ncbi:phospholipase D-like domain-containing protein [Candidatus Omnitrophota bacterium]